MDHKRPPRPQRPAKPDAPSGDGPSTPAAEGAAPEGDRIAKVLARAGVASRRDAEKMIEAGRVTVNGKQITSPALNVTGADRVTVDGKPLAAAEPARLWLYHKPAGLVTTSKDEQGRETIFDKLPEDLPRVMSVGRLDLNSEGLLLLTNDGALKRHLELPATGWMRKYRVRVKGEPTDEMLAPLREGVVVDRVTYQPMVVSIDRQQGANAWLTVGLREGKNREIRRAMENIGLVVNRLIRVSYGPFQLGPLKQGEVEEVRRRVLRDQLGMDPEPEEEAGAVKPRPRRVIKKRPPQTEAPWGDDAAPKGKPRGAKPGGKSGPRTGSGEARGPRSGGGNTSGGAFTGGKPGGRHTAKSGSHGAGSGKPGAGRPDSGTPGAGKPGGGKPGGGRPGASKPGSGKPSAGKPSAGRPGGGKFGGGKSGGAGPRSDGRSTPRGPGPKRGR